MAKIPFDIKLWPEIESGRYKVATEHGEPVEIVKWDCKGKYPILAVISDGDTDDSCFYGPDGVSPSSKEKLFILTDEPDELTEFEKAVKEAILAWHNPKEWAPEDSFIREIAEKPLAAAREQIHREHSEKGIRYITDKELADYLRRERIDGYERGREDAEKEHKEATAFHWPLVQQFGSFVPPCYVGGPCTNPHHDCINCPHTGTSEITKTGTNIK